MQIRNINEDSKYIVDSLIKDIIPMSAQDDFKFNLDRTDNVVALCSHCHKAIHYGDENTIIDILRKIFKDREEYLKKAGIVISIDELYNKYYK